MAYDFISDKKVKRTDIYDPASPTGRAAEAMNRRAGKVLSRVPGLTYAAGTPGAVAEAYQGSGGGVRGIGAATGALTRRTAGQAVETVKGSLANSRDIGMAGASLVSDPVIRKAKGIGSAVRNVGAGFSEGLSGRVVAPAQQSRRTNISNSVSPRQVGVDRPSAHGGINLSTRLPVQKAQRHDATVPLPTPRRQEAKVAAPSQLAPSQRQAAAQERQSVIPQPRRGNPLESSGNIRMGNLDVRFNDDVGMDDRRRFANAAPLDSTSTWEDMRSQRLDRRNSPGYIPQRQRPEEQPSSIGEMIMARGRLNLDKGRASIENERARTRQDAIENSMRNRATLREQDITAQGQQEERRANDARLGFDRDKLTAERERQSTIDQAQLRGLDLSAGASELELDNARQVQSLRSQVMDRSLPQEQRNQAREDLSILQGQRPTKYQSGSYEEMTDEGPIKRPFVYDPENPEDWRPLGPQPGAQQLGAQVSTAAEKLASFKGTPQQKAAEEEYIKRYGKLPEGY